MPNSDRMWSFNFATCFPPATSHTSTCFSSPDVAKNRPSAEKQTALQARVCAAVVRRGSQRVVSMSRISPFFYAPSPAATRSFPSGLNSITPFPGIWRTSFPPSAAQTVTLPADPAATYRPSGENRTSS